MMDLSEEMKEFYSESIIEELKKSLLKRVFIPKFKRFYKLCRFLKLGKYEWQLIEQNIPKEITVRRYAPIEKTKPITEGEIFQLPKLKSDCFIINLEEKEVQNEHTK